MKKKGNGIQRGQAITFRLPSDTPDHIIRQLQKLKETERRNFSSKIAEFVLNGVSHSLDKERETVTLPLPKQLSKEQRNWLKHSHSEALLGNIVYQLLSDPIRAASVLASLNSNALDIDEALYLQEYDDGEIEDHRGDEREIRQTQEVNRPSPHSSAPVDDMESIDWNQLMQEQAASDERSAGAEEEEEVEDDILGDFLSKMNK